MAHPSFFALVLFITAWHSNGKADAFAVPVKDMKDCAIHMAQFVQANDETGDYDGITYDCVKQFSGPRKKA